MMNHSTKRGFTLIELVVYIGIAGVLMLVVVTLYASLQRAQHKGQSISVVESEGPSAMNMMLQSVRNAQSITTPASGVLGTTLSITTNYSSTTPTVFSVSGNALKMTEGSASPNSLTSPQVVVTGFAVTNTGVSGTYGSVKIQFTLSHATTTSRFDTAYSKTFYGSATVRRIYQ